MQLTWNPNTIVDLTSLSRNSLERIPRTSKHKYKKKGTPISEQTYITIETIIKYGEYHKDGYVSIDKGYLLQLLRNFNGFCQKNSFNNKLNNIPDSLASFEDKQNKTVGLLNPHRYNTETRVITQ